MPWIPTQNGKLNSFEDTRDIMLFFITWGKELHLSNKIFIGVYGFCIENMRQQKWLIPRCVYESKAIQKVYR